MGRYITPYSLGDVMPAPVQQIKERDELLRTTFYLPTKSALVGTNFAEEVILSINPFLLLSLRKLAKLRLTLSVGGKSIVSELQCTRVPLSNSDGLQRSIKKHNPGALFSLLPSECCCATLLQTHSNREKQADEFHIFSFTLPVPDDVAVEENDRTGVDSTTVRFAFPTVLDRTFPVFAGLPVYDVGLKFIVDADWVLVTSRESVHDNSFNRYIRSQLCGMLVSLMTTVPFIRKEFFRFLPMVRDQTPLWWRPFISETAQLVKKQLTDILKTHGIERQLLANPSVLELV